MNTEKGWIKLHRDILNQAIWVNGTPEQNVILITLLCMANHKANSWEFEGRPYTVMPGQMITSLPSIVERCACKNITIQKVRTALARLVRMGVITDQTSKTNRLITIVKWAEYQTGETEASEDQHSPNIHLTDTQHSPNTHLTDAQHSSNIHSTSNKNVKNDKNYKKEKNYKKYNNIKKGMCEGEFKNKFGYKQRDYTKEGLENFFREKEGFTPLYGDKDDDITDIMDA